MYRSPIRDENFPEAWDYGCRKYRRARKVSLMRSLMIPVSQVLYFLCFLVLTYGVFYDGFPGLQPFLRLLPGAGTFWEQCSAFLFDGFSGLDGQLLSLGIFLYGLPLAAALGLLVLIFLLYHPARPVLSQDPQLHAGNLLSVSQQIQQHTELRHGSFLSLFSLLYALILAAGTILFLILCRDTPAAAELLRNGWAQAGLYLILAWVVLLGLYLLLNLPLKLVLELLCMTNISPAFSADVQAFYHAKNRKKEKDPEQAPDPE